MGSQKRLSENYEGTKCATMQAEWSDNLPFQETMSLQLRLSKFGNII